MVIVLKNDASESEKKNIKSLLKSKSFKINEVKGEESTILAAVGKLAMDTREVEVLPGVEKVVPISKPYKMASREFKPENTIVEVPNNRGQISRVGGSRLVSIGGPCAVESREQMLEAAAAVAQAGATMLRGGARPAYACSALRYAVRTAAGRAARLWRRGCGKLRRILRG